MPAAKLAVHEEAGLHQACADNDHDAAEKIIHVKMSGDHEQLIELKNMLLHPNANKQAWPRGSHTLSPDLYLTV